MENEKIVREIRLERNSLITNFLASISIILLGIIGYLVDGYLGTIDRSLLNISNDISNIKVSNAKLSIENLSLKKEIEIHSDGCRKDHKEVVEEISNIKNRVSILETKEESHGK